MITSSRSHGLFHQSKQRRWTHSGKIERPLICALPRRRLVALALITRPKVTVGRFRILPCYCVTLAAQPAQAQWQTVKVSNGQTGDSIFIFQVCLLDFRLTMTRTHLVPGPAPGLPSDSEADLELETAGLYDCLPRRHAAVLHEDQIDGTADSPRIRRLTVTA